MQKSKLILLVALVALPLFIIFLFAGFAIGRNGNLLLVVLALACVAALIFFFVSGNKKETALTETAVADARQMQAPSGMARLYIVRDGFVGGQQGMDIQLDSTHRGQIKSGRALLADLPAGQHTVSARMARGGDKSNAAITLDLAAGSITVLHMTTSMGGGSASIRMSVLDDASVAKGKLDKARFLAWEA